MSEIVVTHIGPKGEILETSEGAVSYRIDIFENGQLVESESGYYTEEPQRDTFINR